MFSKLRHRIGFIPTQSLKHAACLSGFQCDTNFLLFAFTRFCCLLTIFILVQLLGLACNDFVILDINLDDNPYEVLKDIKDKYS